MDSIFGREYQEYLNDGVYCMCDEKYRPGAKKVRELSHDFMSLFLEKNSDGTKNLRLKGNELEYRIKRRIKNADMSNVADFISKIPTLISVDLSYNPIIDSGLEILTRNIFKFDNNIQHLNLTGCDISKNGLAALCDVLSNLVLKTLRLTGNKLGPGSGETFCSLLTANNTLEQLDVANTDQTIISIPHFCTALRVDMGMNESLKVLDLSNVIPTSKMYQCQPTKLCELLGDMFKMNNTLVELHIQKCSLDGHCIETLLAGLRRNATLLHLDLGFNRISNYGAEQLSDWFKSAPELIGINIAGNSIGELGARALSFGLPYSKLRLLDLSQNKITDQGISEILLSIKKIQRIRLFFIFGNEIGPLSKDILERQLLAGVYEQSNIDFQMFRTTEGLEIARYPSNEYKHKLYNQLDHADVRELRIRRNILPGPYCERHAKIHFTYYDRVDGSECYMNPKYDPDKLKEEELRQRCLERELQKLEGLETKAKSKKVSHKSHHTKEQQLFVTSVSALKQNYRSDIITMESMGAIPKITDEGNGLELIRLNESDDVSTLT